MRLSELLAFLMECYEDRASASFLFAKYRDAWIAPMSHLMSLGLVSVRWVEGVYIYRAMPWG